MAPPGRYSRKRATLNLSGAQLGDVTTRDSAGGNINNFDPRALATLLRFLEGDRHSRDLFATALEHLGHQLDAHELMQARRDDADVKERAQRREELDAALLALRQGQAIARRWLFALTVAWLVGVLAWALIFWRVFAMPPVDAAALLRLWAGAGLALAAQLWRH